MNLLKRALLSLALVFASAIFFRPATTSKRADRLAAELLDTADFKRRVVEQRGSELVITYSVEDVGYEGVELTFDEGRLQDVRRCTSPWSMSMCMALF